MSKSVDNEKVIDLLREDFDLPRKVDLHSIIDGVLDAKVIADRESESSFAITSGKFYIDTDKNDMFILYPKNNDLYKLLTDKEMVDENANLSEVPRDECENLTLKLLNVENNLINGQISLKELSANKLNEIVDSELEGFFVSLEKNDISKVEDHLKNLTAVTTLYDSLEENWIKAVAIEPVVDKMKKDNPMLVYEQKKVILKKQELQDMMDSLVNPLRNQMKTYQSMIMDKEVIYTLLKNGDKKGLESHVACSAPYQRGFIASYNKVNKEIKEIQQKYINRVSVQFENARISLLKRYKGNENTESVLDK